MPVTKNAALRYRLIDECLQRRQKIWTAALLLETVADKFYQATGQKLSKSQFNQDLNAMREGGSTGYNAPITYSRDRGYQYADSTFSISNSPLGSADAAVLRQALTALRQFQGLGLSEELDDIIRRVESHLHQQASEVGEPPIVILFEQVSDYVGTLHLAPLYQAIREQQPLRLRYRAFESAESWEETVQPYLLKQFNHRWFLVGQGTGRAGISNYALDRIEGIKKETDTPYLSPPESLGTHFQDIVGVSVPSETPEPVLVRLRFRAERGQYVRTKPLHTSQQLEVDASDEVIISLWVRPNRELETLLLSFGDDVEVLTPPPLRQRMAKRLQVAARKYT